jgi:hypothetical protein
MKKLFYTATSVLPNNSSASIFPKTPMKKGEKMVQ